MRPSGNRLPEIGSLVRGLARSGIVPLRISHLSPGARQASSIPLQPAPQLVRSTGVPNHERTTAVQPITSHER
jgi:hypothetical protein